MSTATPPSQQREPVILDVILFAIVFPIAIGLIFSELIPLALEMRSVNFPLAEGVVTHSKWERRVGADRLQWNLEYTFVVDGKSYIGTRYAAGVNAYSYTLPATFPAGTRVSVAYNPDDPADAELYPGQPGRIFEHAAMVLLIVGLAALFLGDALLTLLVDPAVRARQFAPPDPRQVVPTVEGLRIRLPRLRMVHLFIGIWGAFGGRVFTVLTRPEPPDPYPLWAVSLLGVIVPVVILALAIGSRRPAVFLAPTRRRLVFVTRWPWRRIDLSFEDVVNIWVVTQILRGRGGDTPYYQVMLRYTVANQSREVIMCEYSTREDADALVTWLRERTGLDNRVG